MKYGVHDFFFFWSFLFPIECPALLNGSDSLNNGIVSTGVAFNEMKE